MSGAGGPGGASSFTEAAVLGVVVGDTNTVGAFWEPRSRAAEVLPNNRGDRLTPTAAIRYTAVGSRQPQVFVGDDALAKEKKQQGGLIKGLRRYVGLSANDLDLDALSATAPRVVPDRTGTRLMAKSRAGSDGDSEIPVEHLTLQMVKFLKDRLEGTQLPPELVPLRQIVVAVPAYYAASQREAVRRTLLSLENVTSCSVVSEPLAALVGSGALLETTLHRSGKCCVVADIGGTSVTLSLLRESASHTGAPIPLQSVGCIGVVADLDMGSASVNSSILEDISAKYAERAASPLPDRLARQLAPEIERLKWEGKGTLDVDLPDADDASSDASAEFEYTLDPAALAGFARASVGKSIRSLTASLLKSTGVRPSEVSHVILAGGGTRLPGVEAHFQGVFPDADVLGGGKHAPDQTPDHVIALGCAKLGAFFATCPAGWAPFRDAMDLDPHAVAFAPAGGVEEPAAAAPPPPPPPAAPLASVSSGRTAAAIAIAVSGGSCDILIHKDTTLPAAACRHFGCAVPYAQVNLLELHDQDNPASAIPLGSATLRLPTRALGLGGSPGGRGSGGGGGGGAAAPPTTAVRVSVSALGAVEVQAVSPHPENASLTVISSAVLGAPVGGAAAGKQQQPQQGKRGGGGGSAAHTPHLSASSQPAQPPAGGGGGGGAGQLQGGGGGGGGGAEVEADGVHDAEDILIELYDKYQALVWFFDDMRSFDGAYEPPKAAMAAIQAAMGQALQLTQTGGITAQQAAEGNRRLHDTCSVAVGQPPAQAPLINLALGLWEFVIAPQGDDTALLSQALVDLKTPPDHAVSQSGDTLLHSIAMYGAVQCWKLALNHLGKPLVAQLLQKRNTEGLTPVELAALQNHEALSREFTAVLSHQ